MGFLLPSTHSHGTSASTVVTVTDHEPGGAEQGRRDERRGRRPIFAERQFNDAPL
jgi:hypothetical protein